MFMVTFPIVRLKIEFDIQPFNLSPFTSFSKAGETFAYTMKTMKGVLLVLLEV